MTQEELMNARFAMAKRDVWVQGDGRKTIGYICGTVYPILPWWDGKNKIIKSSDSRYFLPMNNYEEFYDDFMKDFMLVEEANAIVYPYSDIKLLLAEINEIKKKHAKELEPLKIRHENELAPLEQKLSELEKDGKNMQMVYIGLVDRKRCKKCGSVPIASLSTHGYNIVRCSSLLCDNSTEERETKGEALSDWDAEN